MNLALKAVVIGALLGCGCAPGDVDTSGHSNEASLVPVQWTFGADLKEFRNETIVARGYLQDPGKGSPKLFESRDEGRCVILGLGRLEWRPLVGRYVEVLGKVVEQGPQDQREFGLTTQALGAGTLFIHVQSVREMEAPK